VAIAKCRNAYQQYVNNHNNNNKNENKTSGAVEAQGPSYGAS